MSRIGRQPIPVPAGVTVSIEPESVRVNGPKGELSERVNRDIEVVTGGRGRCSFARPTDRGEHRALHGLTRTLVANMVQGVTKGYEKRLEIQGVGYRPRKDKNLELAVGYANAITIPAPEGVEFEVPQPTRRHRQRGLQADRRRVRGDGPKQRQPEPYKGKGIRYENE